LGDCSDQNGLLFGETALWRIRNPFNANDTLPIDHNEATQLKIDSRVFLFHGKYHAWPFQTSYCQHIQTSLGPKTKLRRPFQAMRHRNAKQQIRRSRASHSPSTPPSSPDTRAARVQHEANTVILDPYRKAYRSFREPFPRTNAREDNVSASGYDLAPGRRVTVIESPEADIQTTPMLTTRV
jgi:hypothetical protein